MKRATIALLLAVGMLVAVPPFADVTLITIDELTGNCNRDTGCTVMLPFACTPGQVLLSDDGLRLDGFDASADTFGPPQPAEHHYLDRI